MSSHGFQVFQVRHGHTRLYLVVSRVPGLQQHFLPRLHLQDGGDVRVPPVVTLGRLFLEAFAAVYLYAFHLEAP